MKRTAMMLSVVLVVLVFPSPAVAAPFVDVYEGEYYAEAASWLHRAGIFLGDGGGRLEPESVFTRAHMAVVLARMTGQGALIEAFSTGRTGWHDDDLIPSWARGAFVLAEARGWFVGREDGTVAPTDELAWEEIAILLARVTDNDHLGSGSWPTSAMTAAGGMDLFADLPERPLPGIPVLRGQMTVVTWAAIRTPTGLGLERQGQTLLSLYHGAIASAYLDETDAGTALLTVEEVAERALPATVTVVGRMGALGTGFHVGSGRIVTNFHVIEGRTDLGLLTHTGEHYAVSGVLAADVGGDLAVLTAPGLDVPHLDLSLSEVRVGQAVVAVGSPLGLAGTVSTGIISAPNRDLFGQSFIQTTAPISPGSSGSPLLNLSGDVVGVITMAAVDPAVQTINFAIPSHRVHAIADGAKADPSGLGAAAAQNLSIEQMDLWLEALLEGTLFEFSSVMGSEDGAALWFYLWIPSGDNCQHFVRLVQEKRERDVLETFLQMVAEFLRTNSGRPTAGTIVCWDRWTDYPQVLADAGWEVYGEPGDWISSRSLLWIYLWEPDDYLVDWSLD